MGFETRLENIRIVTHFPIIFGVRVVSMRFSSSLDDDLFPSFSQNVRSGKSRIQLNLMVRFCVHNVPQRVWRIFPGSSRHVRKCKNVLIFFIVQNVDKTEITLRYSSESTSYTLFFMGYIEATNSFNC